MSLYYESAHLIETLNNSKETSLKTLLFSKSKPGSDTPRKSSPSQLYALVIEAWKWSPVLTDVIERAGFLGQEKKLSPHLALVLVHDLLFTKRGIAAPEGHVLRQAIERHQTRIKAEFTKARIRAGCASVEDLKKKLDTQNQEIHSSEGVDDNERKRPHPRWLRINTLRVSQNLLDREDFRSWKAANSLEEVLSHRNDTGNIIYHVDEHIPNLLALPPGTNLSEISAYKQGELISQDKASCFPAYLLSSGSPFDGDILDACAAPGNKTSHLAAIVSEQGQHNLSDDQDLRIFAVERDARRATVLQQLLTTAGANHVRVHASQDFLKLDVNKVPWNTVSAIILDPSCSGSGIVDRGQIMAFKLPTASNASFKNGSQQSRKSKKRKRKENEVSQDLNTHSNTDKIPINEQDIEIDEDDAVKLETRLKCLAALQTKMLTFAFSFPRVERITYSTCSVHDIENEGVVIAALSSQVAQSRGWRIMKRNEQIQGMQLWKNRGKKAACQSAVAVCGEKGLDVDEIAEACIRCEPFTNEGTQGFFVAGFVKDHEENSQHEEEVEDDEEQWTGFDD